MAARPKGYIAGLEANFKPATLELIEQTKAVIEEYRAFLPLTARQIFYRLVGQFGYDKTELAYGRLCEALVKARRAQLIPFSAIRDDGTKTAGSTGGWESPAEWWDGELAAAQAYSRDLMEGQAVAIEVWCEAEGVAPIVGGVSGRYGIQTYATGGFSSVTVTHEIAQRVRRRDAPTVFLHVGDFDPSGESIFKAMSEDVEAFLFGHGDDAGFEAARVALTGEQVAFYDLPTAPPKKSDSRSASWVGETCQLEAMDPATLSVLVQEAIEDRLDLELRDRVIARSEREREKIVAEVERNLKARDESDDEDGE